MPQGQIDVGGSVSNVMVGSVKLYVAPSGTTLPNVDGTYPIVWPVGWVGVGYTDKGVDFSYSPSVKDITVDEELAPVMFVLSAEKGEITAVLAESTLANLNKAISASTLTGPTVADLTHGVFSTLEFGSGTLTEVMIGFEGFAPPDTGSTLYPAVLVAYRAMAQGAVKLNFQRTEKQMYQCTWSLLADSTQAVGKRLVKYIQITAPHS